MFDQITDFITGREIDNVGAEASRQIFEKFLVKTKGYEKTDIQVDVPLIVQFKGEDYHSAIDLVVFCQDRPLMAVTCVAGSIGSYEREILAGARLCHDHMIPFAVSTDARDAIVMDTLSGETVGKGLDSILSQKQAQAEIKNITPALLDPAKREGEMIIYRSFNLEKVNK
ncbi:MAG: type I restriction enzyme HsdR N-terminal domain-containing protein [Desulfobacter sp.]|nr:type I restriction enzyme HsdR N-terminal domain-containing protein [Desulfobacter sp.]WDP86984.1 MAG: type I restriction enzyme HsdR N-terminal domain-containing protein [Desulfobacter sp.]